MLTAQPRHLNQQAGNKPQLTVFPSDKMALAFIGLAMSYLLLGLTFGLLGGFQYVLPQFLREQLAFQKVRPLHVYLAISWIFTAAQGCIYYFLPRIAKRALFWKKGISLHFVLQVLTSLSIVVAFFGGYFGGREYLEFPPLLGVLIPLSWVPFAINFFGTLRPNFKNAPVYYFSWTIGICFFFITLSESYLWLFDHFNNNQVRDTTVQWKALGSMVGSWNMLVYGISMHLMEKLKTESKINYSKTAFFFFFLGFTNLLFNWGHHTYVVPAAPWVKTVAYVISMTELLIFGQLLFAFRKTMSNAQKNFHILPYRLLSFADLWIFLNLGAAIAISVPALNYFTHGTHITVAHAMGTTIGINTMLLFAAIFYILQERSQHTKTKTIKRGILITNLALLIFWTSLIGSGLVKIAAKLQAKSFAQMMKACEPFFKLFAASGVFILLGLGMLIFSAFSLMRKSKERMRERENSFSSPFHIN
ncbi:MAG: cbb3-type cytochrome c oxidase subunit I [Chitinophagaceae bacterium]|nr:MAG: cbb3-type cytochrome c oxidase subunit I [Chitinophagaceae bacterium]